MAHFLPIMGQILSESLLRVTIGAEVKVSFFCLQLKFFQLEAQINEKNIFFKLF